MHLGTPATLPTTWIVLSLLLASCSAPSVSLSPEEPALPKETGTKIPTEHVAGAEIYESKCSLCHAHGESGAPRFANAKQWTKRSASGLQTLTDHAFNGFEGNWGEMPAQSDDLSREQVKAAIQYMLFAANPTQQTELP